jgi:cytidylate kinase
MTDAPPRTLVTIAALYGAGGSVIGPQIAERLGVEFLDRAIPARVAEQAGLTPDAVAAADEDARGAVGPVVATLARVSNAVTGEQDLERVDQDYRRIRVEIEEFLARTARSGGVVLGRGGAVICGGIAGALHVYLGGRRDARIAATMKEEGVDHEAAERLVRAHDRARRAYVQDAYGVDGDDPNLYHLMLDVPALGTDACVDLIVAASRARAARPEAGTPA